MKTIVHSYKINQLKVVHYRSSFLPLTENWIYNQVSESERICAKFYAIVRENKDSFFVENLRCLQVVNITVFPDFGSQRKSQI